MGACGCVAGTVPLDAFGAREIDDEGIRRRKNSVTSFDRLQRWQLAPAGDPLPRDGNVGWEELAAVHQLQQQNTDKCLLERGRLGRLAIATVGADGSPCKIARQCKFVRAVQLAPPAARPRFVAVQRDEQIDLPVLEKLDQNGGRVRFPFAAGIISAYVTEEE